MQRYLISIVCMVFLAISFSSNLSAADNKKLKKGEYLITQPKSELNNQAWMAALRMYAEGTGLKMQQYGRGSFRLFSLGTVTFKEPEELIKVGETSLLWMEKWTGNQKMFLPRTKSEADAYCIVVVQDDKLFDQILKFLRDKGAAQKPADAKDDLTKALKTAVSPRIFITTAKKFNAIDKNWVAHFIGSNALSTYYHERHNNAPIWLAEGLKGELERKATKKVLIRTISYENNKRESSMNWAQDMARLVKKGDKELLKSTMVMELDLIGMSHKQYVQLWSYGSFIRAVLSGGKKAKNRYAQLINRTAEGEEDYKVLKDVLGKHGKNPETVTNAWWGWARTQK